jgi:uncharacterized membrane protein YgcG
LSGAPPTGTLFGSRSDTEPAHVIGPTIPARTRAARLPGILSSLVASLALVLTIVGASAAQSVPKLNGSVTDVANVLTAADRSTAESGISTLNDQHNIQLYALFVATTGDQAAPDYATEVAAQNSLGGNDALLVVVVDDRRDAIWVGPLLGAITDTELDTILASYVEPALQHGAWGQAIADGAQAIGQAAAGDISGGGGGGGSNDGGTPAPTQPANLGWIGWVIGFLLVLGGVALVWWWFMGWRSQRREAEERDRRTGELARRANSLLVGTDEILRQDEQEIGFAEAQFGADAVASFRPALTAARTELQAAFKVRQLLDDEVPEDPPTRERMLGEIVTHCEKAQQLVDAETERFRQLRDLQRRAPQILAELPEQLAAIERRVPAARTALRELEQNATSSAATVRGNLEEAVKRIALAREAVKRGSSGSESVGTADAPRAEPGAQARAAKAAQDAAAQATSLLDAIDKAVAALEDARARLPDALDAARADVGTARKELGEAFEQSAGPEVRDAEGKLEAADQASQGSPRDFILALRLAQEAESAAAAVVARIREGEQQRAKSLAAADAAIRAADQAVDRAEQFISARRHGVGRLPRTRLADARAALEQARSARDRAPDEAAQDARKALDRADEAYRAAASEFDETDAAGYGGTVVINGQPYPMGRSGRLSRRGPGPGWGSDVGGAILGGIIGGILSGGGHRGGWGGPFGGGGFGGFGGGGRSAGGGFGGGGGRAHGGGW